MYVTGRDFIDQLTKHIDDWNNRSPLQHLALKVAIVLLAVALQKPGQRSKAKEHQECLKNRLTLWRNGEIGSLLREGRMIQRRLSKSHKNDPPNKAHIFAKLVMEGQINSALRYLSEDDSGEVLPLTDDVVRQLGEKHPEAQRAKLGSLLFGPVEEIHDLVYQEINGELVREAALRTKGSGGPSGVDANGFKRILACKSFKRSSVNLCESIATLTRRLCTEFVDPLTIEPIVASRLIPLDKGNGKVRPIGVGEVIRRIIGKCVTKVAKQDVTNASGAMQVCAGQKSGGEAAIHAMRNISEADETDAALLVDASNAFNSLNRAAALNNIRVLCPLIATYVTNTYRVPARLFVVGGSELKSAEGTTQGDPLAMSMYAISLQPLISLLHNRSTAKQCWFAEGRKHLGAALGSRSYLEQYVGGKVEDWVGEVTRLAEFARSQPQASYAAFTFGLRYRWTYFMRTLPDIENLLQPLERAISDVLIPSLIERNCSEAERDLVALPVRMGGLGLINPSVIADAEY